MATSLSGYSQFHEGTWTAGDPEACKTADKELLEEARQLTLYHCVPTRSARAVWLLEELGDVPVRIKEVKFRQRFLKSAEYLRLHPLGKLPVLTDGTGLLLHESGAIVLYLLERFGRGRLQPSQKDAAGRAALLGWCFRAETELSLPLQEYMLHNFLLPAAARKPDIAAAGLQRAMQGYAVLEAALLDRTWLINDTFSAADIMIGTSVHYLRSLRLQDEPRFPGLAAYLQRIQHRTAYQTAYTIGGGRETSGSGGNASSVGGNGSSVISRL